MNMIRAFLFFASLGLAWLGLSQMKTFEENSSGEVNHGYLPKASYVRLVALGHSESMASYIWVQSLVKFGEVLYSNKTFQRFAHYGDLVTSLDSLFYQPYYYVGATANMPDSAVIRTMDRAIRVYPGDWRLALYYAMFISKQYQDYAKAAKVMELYITPSDTIPIYVSRLYKTFRLKQQPVEASLSMLLDDYTNPKNNVFAKGIFGQIVLLVNPKPIKQDSIHVKQLLDKLTTHNSEVQQRVTYQGILQMAKKRALLVESSEK